MRRSVVGSVIVLLGLLGSACNRAEGPSGPSGPSIDHPMGADQLVLRVQTGGGLVSPEISLRQVPQFSMYGDGRVITQGAQTEIYPGPALQNLLVNRIDAEGIQRILQAAFDAGLGGASHHYCCGVPDAGTTTFTLVADGRRHVVTLPAGPIEGTVPGGATAGADEQAIAKLTSFQGKLVDLRNWLPDGDVGPTSTYGPTTLRVFVQRAVSAPETSLQEPAIDWPLAHPLASFGSPYEASQGLRCGTVLGAELGTLLPEVKRATEISPWRSRGRTYRLTFRPLLPDEQGCSN